MSSNEENLKAFIQKILEIKATEKPISTEEMRQIAKELGMTDDDWLRIEQAFEGYLLRAKGHLKYENWQEAIEELQQALALNPYHKEVVQSLALAYYGKYKQTHKSQDKEKALAWTEKIILIDPHYAPAFKIRSELKQNFSPQRANPTSLRSIFLSFSLLFAMGMGVAIVFVAQNKSNIRIQTNKERRILENTPKTAQDLQDLKTIDNKQFKTLAWESIPKEGIAVEALQKERYISSNWGGLRNRQEMIITFKNIGEQTLKQLRVLVIWYNKKQEEVARKSYNIIKKDAKVQLAPQQTIDYKIKKTFWNEDKDLSYIIKVLRAD